MHPMSQTSAYQSAKQLLQQIAIQYPHLTLGQFLDHPTANAAVYDLKYRHGNVT